MSNPSEDLEIVVFPFEDKGYLYDVEKDGKPLLRGIGYYPTPEEAREAGKQSIKQHADWRKGIVNDLADMRKKGHTMTDVQSLVQPINAKDYDVVVSPYRGKWYRWDVTDKAGVVQLDGKGFFKRRKRSDRGGQVRAFEVAQLAHVDTTANDPTLQTEKGTRDMNERTIKAKWLAQQVKDLDDGFWRLIWAIKTTLADIPPTERKGAQGERAEFIREFKRFSRKSTAWISDHTRIAESWITARGFNPGENLPPAPTVLRELTKLSKWQARASIKRGEIHHTMRRKDANEVVRDWQARVQGRELRKQAYLAGKVSSAGI